MPRCDTKGEFSSHPRASAAPSARAASPSICPASATVEPTLQATLSRMATATRSVAEVCASAKQASRELAIASTADRNAALARLAELLTDRDAEVLEANAGDLADERAAGLTEALRDRLT